jgi:hypothetical protein
MPRQDGHARKPVAEKVYAFSYDVDINGCRNFDLYSASHVVDDGIY